MSEIVNSDKKRSKPNNIVNPFSVENIAGYSRWSERNFLKFQFEFKHYRNSPLLASAKSAAALKSLWQV